MLGTTLEIRPIKKTRIIAPKATFLPKTKAKIPDILLIMPVFSSPPINTKKHIKKIKVLQSTSRRIFCTESMRLWWESISARAAPKRATVAGDTGIGNDSPITKNVSTKAVITMPTIRVRGWLIWGWGRRSRLVNFLRQILRNKNGRQATTAATASTPPKLSCHK